MKAFKDLRVETVTTICNCEDIDIDLMWAFIYMPVINSSHVDKSLLKKRGDKIPIPQELNERGKIISMRLNDLCRGFERTEDPKSFRHSITIDIGTSMRSLSVKLSRSKVSITGPDSHLLANEVIESLNENLKEGQKRLDALREYVRTNKLNDTVRQMKSEYLPANFRAMLERLRVELGIEKLINSGYMDFDESLIAYDFDKISQFLSRPETCFRYVVKGELKMEKFHTAMVNLNFSLGHRVWLSDLTEIMNGGEFSAYSNNVMAKKCRVIYKDEEEGIHKITIAKTGRVRYSGPSLEMMERGYNLLLERLEANKEKFIMEEDVFS